MKKGLYNCTLRSQNSGATKDTSNHGTSGNLCITPGHFESTISNLSDSHYSSLTPHLIGFKKVEASGLMQKATPQDPGFRLRHVDSA